MFEAKLMHQQPDPLPPEVSNYYPIPPCLNLSKTINMSIFVTPLHLSLRTKSQTEARRRRIYPLFVVFQEHSKNRTMFLYQGLAPYSLCAKSGPWSCGALAAFRSEGSCPPHTTLHCAMARQEGTFQHWGEAAGKKRWQWLGPGSGLPLDNIADLYFSCLFSRIGLGPT